MVVLILGALVEEVLDRVDLEGLTPHMDLVTMDTVEVRGVMMRM